MGILQDSGELLKLAGRMANPELLQRVTALNEQVLELSTKNLEFRERITTLEKEVEVANKKLHVIGEVKRDDGYIYHSDEPDPCCSYCFDSQRILIRVLESTHQGSVTYCPHCKSSVGGRRPKGLRRKL